jgi:hypothetical protein
MEETLTASELRRRYPKAAKRIHASEPVSGVVDGTGDAYVVSIRLAAAAAQRGPLPVTQKSAAPAPSGAETADQKWERLLRNA